MVQARANLMAIQQILAKPGAKVMAKLKISNGAVAMFCRDLLHLKAGKPLLPPPFLVAPRTLSVPDLRHRRAEAPAGALPLTEQLPRTGLPPSAASVHLHPVCALSLSLSATTGWATAAAAADAQRQVPRPSSVSSLVTSIRQAASSRQIAARAWFALTTYTVISASDPTCLRLFLHRKK